MKDSRTKFFRIATIYSAIAVFVIVIFSLTIFVSCNKTHKAESQAETGSATYSGNGSATGTGVAANARTKSIAVFVPGVASGNPVYEMLVKGVQKACDEFGISATVIEAGTNQAEWNAKLTALAASSLYDVIISSNPSLPDLIVPLAAKYPKTKYIVLDAFCESNPNVATIRYNQKEQGFFAGLVAGLITISDDSSLKYANAQKKIALIAAQEYPVMNEVIFPSFEEGAKFVDPEISVEFRVVGSWADATKAFEIANSLYNNGTDVILPIAGAGSQGVIAAAKEKGFYITWFDEDGYNKAPGYIVSSTTIAQEKLAYEVTKQYLNEKTEFGSAKTLGIKDGYVEFIFENDIYKQTVPTSIQNKIADVYSKVLSGEYEFSYPTKH